MTSRLLSIVMKGALLIALAASSALFVDYRAVSTFCGAQSGCAKVRASDFSSFAGIDLPIFGMAAFAVLFVFSLLVGREQLRIFGGMLALVALAALGLIGLQLFKVGAVCALCMAVDVAAIVAAGTGLLWIRRGGDREPGVARAVWALAGVVAVAVPLLTGSKMAELPPGLAELQARDKVTLITFTDFECPFCRMMHPVFDELKNEHGDRLTLVRVMKPLDMHPGAVPAARVYLCAPESERDRLADRLYNAKFGTLNRSSAIAHAVELGMDRQALEACYDSPETNARLEREEKLFEEAELRGLPSTFVGSELIEGAEVDGLRYAVKRALAGASSNLSWLSLLLLLALVCAAGVSLWAARGANRAPEPARSAPS
jgi:uncharacterized membrane protein/predicted DsbA family dithiol-disulfide isomerase